MIPYEQFIGKSLDYLKSKHPEWSEQDFLKVTSELSDVYKEQNLERPEVQKQELNTYGALDTASALGKASLDTTKAIAKDIIPASVGLATGAAELATSALSGAGQLATGFFSPKLSENIKYMGRGIKENIAENKKAADLIFKGKQQEPEQEQDYVAKAKQVREEFKNPEKNNPSWFSNLVEKTPGGEELFQTAKDLAYMPVQAAKDVADSYVVASTAAMSGGEGKGYFDPEFAKRVAENPVETLGGELIGGELGLKGLKAIKEAKTKMVEPEAIQIPGYEIKEGQAVPLSTEEVMRDLQAQGIQQEIAKQRQTSPIESEGKPITDVIEESQKQVAKEETQTKLNELQAKLEKDYLEAQMKDEAKAYRQTRQAEPEETLGPIQNYETLFKQAEENKALQTVEPQATRTMADILKVGRGETGVKQAPAIESQQGMQIGSRLAPEDMMANPLLRYETIPDFGLDVVDYNKSAENILSKQNNQPLLLTNGRNIATILPSVKEKGKYQLTVFDDKGPIRDITKNSMQEIISEALQDGYQKMSTPEQFNNLTKQTSFLDFMKAKKNISEAPKEYKYQMNARPFGIGAQPPGQIRVEEGGGRHGTIVYDRPLTEKEIYDYELKPIEKINPTKTVQEILSSSEKNLTKQEQKALKKLRENMKPDELSNQADILGSQLVTEIKSQEIAKQKNNYAKTSGLKNGYAFITSLIKGDYPQVISDIKYGRTNLADVETALNDLNKIDPQSVSNNLYFLEKIKNAFKDETPLEAQQGTEVKPEQANIPPVEQPIVDGAGNGINLRNAIPNFLNKFIKRDQVRIGNQLEKKVDGLQKIIDNNNYDSIGIYYDEVGKPQYRLNNPEFQTKISKVEYDFLKSAGMPFEEQSLPISKRGIEKMSIDELRNVPVKDIEQAVSDKNIPYNERVNLNVKLQQIKKSETTVKSILEKGKEFIKSEEGSLNIQPILDFFFKKRERIPSEVLNDTTSEIKNFNDKALAGQMEENKILTERREESIKRKQEFIPRIIQNYFNIAGGATEPLEKYISTNLSPVYKMLTRNKSKEIPASENPKLLADQVFQQDNKLSNYLDRLSPQKLNVNENAFGMFLTAKRIVTERQGIANMFTVDEAQNYLDAVKRLHPEEYNRMGTAQQTLNKVRQEIIIPVIEKSKMFDDDLMNYIKNNIDYSTNMVVNKLKESGGERATGALANIFEQFGSTEAIGNSYANTLFKDLALYRAAVLNRYKLAAIDNLLQYRPDMLMPAKKVVKGTIQVIENGQKVDKPIIEFEKPKSPNLDLVFAKRYGDYEAYVVPKYLKQSLDMRATNIIEPLQAVNEINNLFKSAWIRNNFTFWAPAFAKDLQDGFILMPGFKGKAKWLANIVKEVPIAIASLFDMPRKMIEKVMPTFEIQKKINERSEVYQAEKRSAYGEVNADETPLETKLKSFDINAKTIGGIALDSYQKLGSILERSIRGASQQTLKQMGWQPEEISYYTNMIGSPAFKRYGALTKNMQAIFPFFNPIVQSMDAVRQFAKKDPIGIAASLGSIATLTMFQIAADKGLLGKDLQDYYGKLTTNEKDNYFNMPYIGVKIPIGFLFKPINRAMQVAFNNNPEAFTETLARMGSNILMDELPTFTPALNLAQDISTIASGQRLYDKYRGYYPIAKDLETKPLDAEKALAYAQYFWNNYVGFVGIRANINKKPDYGMSYGEMINPFKRFFRSGKEKEIAESQERQPIKQQAEAQQAYRNWESIKFARGLPADVSALEKRPLMSEMMSQTIKQLPAQEKALMEVKYLIRQKNYQQAKDLYEGYIKAGILPDVREGK